MKAEIQTYLSDLTTLLNGQLRGAINKKAREENEDLIRMTVNDAFEKGQEYGELLITEKFAIESLKENLKDEEEPVKPILPKNQID